MQKTITRRTYSTDQLDNNLHPVLQRIYQARGITETHELEKTLAQLHSWQTLSSINEASELLYHALVNQERILIIGDFDADGATATAIAVSALKSFGFRFVDFLVPNRFTYGYGLTPEIVEAATAFSPQLIITVDNGVASHKGVEAAKQKGIKVLITDHHLPANTLPNADAIVNPNLVNDPFPSKAMAGCGVIFYVMLALRHKLRSENYFQLHNIAEPNLATLLDLVALGTVADVVPLDKNNRILVHQGLLRIQAKQCRPGILALLEVSGRPCEQLAAIDLGFTIGPRLNAAGRLDDMSLGIACLLAETLEEARPMALQLNQLNIERRAIEAQMQHEAWQTLSTMQFNDMKNLPQGVCLYDETWHQGVIGILAGRIKDKLHRPVIAFAKASDTELKGSARSIPGIHIRDVLDYIATRHPDLLEKFGGHAMAAGMTIKEEHFKRFARVFNAAIEKFSTPELLRAEILTDGELSLPAMNIELAEIIRQGGPWGTAFPEPVFDNQFQLLQQYLVGEKHLKMRVSLPGHSAILDAIAFSVDVERWPDPKVEKIHAVYRLDINEYKGLRKVQLVIDYFEPC